MRLEGKVAIVTGASPNIGGAVASGFAREGARVACNDITPETAQRAVERIEAEGGEAIAIPGDVTDESQVRAAVDRVVATWGRVDVLVNNAVQFNVKGLLDMPYDEFNRQTAVIVQGAFLYTKYVAQAMIAGSVAGSIINLLTCAAWQGQPGNIGYCTAKGGLLNFTRSAAMELAGYGIRVNGVTPTATEPESEEARAFRAARAAGRPPPRYTLDFETLIPLGRRPKPSDYVPAFVYLASDESRMVTGTHIAVDGGSLAKYWAWLPKARAARSA